MLLKALVLTAWPRQLPVMLTGAEPANYMPLRWYYHCDRLGMLVWQDMVSGGVMRHFMLKSALSTLGVTKLRDDRYGFFGRRDAEGRRQPRAVRHRRKGHRDARKARGRAPHSVRR